RVHAVPAISGMAGREPDLALLLDLPGGQAVLPRPAAQRPALGLRAHVQPRDGSLGRRADTLAYDPLPTLALRERSDARRDAPGLRPALPAAARLHHRRHRCP